MNQPEDWLSDQKKKMLLKHIRKRSILIALLSMLIILGVGFIFIDNIASNLFSGLCGNQVITERFQPEDSKYKLVIFRRDCGATTGYSYQLSVINKGSELKQAR